jgi:hypothetical protein
MGGNADLQQSQKEEWIRENCRPEYCGQQIGWHSMHFTKEERKMYLNELISQKWNNSFSLFIGKFLAIRMEKNISNAKIENGKKFWTKL